MRRGSPSYFIAQVLDITERKQAEEALRNSERTLRTLIDASPEAIGLVDTEETVLIINETAARRLGTTIGEITGQKLYTFVPPEVAANRRKRVAEVVRTGKPIRFEDQRSGRYIENAMHPVLDEQGKVAAVAILAIDRTDHKRAEEALKQAHDELERRVEERTAELTTANEELQAVYDGMFEGLLILDFETKRLIRVNSSLCQMLGYAEEELLSMSVMDIHPKEETPRIIRTLQARVNEGYRGDVDIRILRKDGSISYVNVIGNPLVYRGRQCIAAFFRDITERRRAAEVLRQSEEKYKALVEASPDAVLMADLETNIVFASQRLAELFGYHSVADLCKQKATVLVAEEERQRLTANMSLLVQQGVRRQIEYIGVRRDGSRFIGEVSSAVLRDDKGEPNGLMAVVRDITEQKRAEEALRQSHDELRAIYDGMVEGLLVTDIETMRVIRANASICRMLGYSKTELRSLSVRDIHPAEALPYILERIHLLDEPNQTPPDNIPFLRKDGSVFYAEVIGSFLTYDGRPCSMGIFRDVTERLRAEAALAESEAKYRQLVETTDTGYLILDAEGLVVDANEEYVRISGHHDLAEIVGHSVVEWTAPYDRPRNAQEVRQCVQAGRIRQLEIDYIGPDGKITPVEINASVITTKEGQRIVSLCRDITERREAQMALERERQSLWRMLQASDHERQTISYEIHDGLAQYLAAAVMQFQAHDTLRENSPDKAKKAYETALELVRQSHSESRRLISEVRPPVIDESGLETAISHLVCEQRRNVGPKIECHSSLRFGRLPAIMENALYRIVQEALTNACKHSKSKKVTVTHDSRGAGRSAGSSGLGNRVRPRSDWKGALRRGGYSTKGAAPRRSADYREQAGFWHPRSGCCAHSGEAD